MELDVTNLARYAADLRAARTLAHKAERTLLNNMAFGVRKTALEEIIPKRMVVRNAGFLARSLHVDKATFGREVAVLGMIARERFSGLAEQEKGGELQRHVATEAARGGGRQGQIKQKARLKGNIIGPEDITIAHEKSYTQRVAVFLEIMARRGSGQVIRLPGKGGMPYPALVRLGASRKYRPKGKGKKATWMKPRASRKMTQLQAFNTKGKTKVKRNRWMKPAIDTWTRRSSPEMEWRRALREVKLWRGRRA